MLYATYMAEKEQLGNLTYNTSKRELQLHQKANSFFQRQTTSNDTV